MSGKDAVERIRRLLKQCHDELVPAEPELPFVSDADIRLGIEEPAMRTGLSRMAASWIMRSTYRRITISIIFRFAVDLRSAPKLMHRQPHHRHYEWSDEIDHAVCEQGAELRRF